jgi:polysaccharide biosynthesis protein PslG
VRNAIQRRVLASLLAIVCSVIPAVTIAPAFLSDSTSKVGAAVADGRNAGIAFNGNVLGLSEARIRSDFSTAKNLGATWIRVPFNWVTLEMHGRGRYNWGPGDKVVNIANSLGLRIAAVVSYTPSWARPPGTNGITPPSNPADYGNFLGAAARRYGPRGVHTWEIWNEPNLFPMWSPRPNVAKYTALLRDAYPKIKAADPSATVITGGTSPADNFPDGSGIKPITFLQGIYNNGGKGYFDAVGHHPATFPYPSTLVADWSAFQQSKDLYAEMQRRGDGAKKIWGTEIGWPTGTSARAVSEQTQGERFAESFAAWEGWGFSGPIFIYTLRDQGTNRADHYQNFGIAHTDGSLKAGVGRIQQALRAPTNVRASGTSSGATVTWNAPAYDYGAPITQYRVFAIPSGINVTVSGGARSANINLPGNNAYRFAVQPIHRGTWPGITSPASSTAVRPSGTTVYVTVGNIGEGDSGTRTLLVPVRLTRPSSQTVTVKYQTARLAPHWNAAVPTDYNAAAGTLTFAPGQTKKNIGITIKGDTAREPNDGILVVLSNATGARIGGFGGAGVGVIWNDD